MPQRDATQGSFCGISHMPAAQREYYDLGVVVTGSKPNDAGVIVRLHERKTYRFLAGTRSVWDGN